MRITHIGHACLLVETGGARVLLDPGTFATGWWELTDLDAILVTHAHPDHVDSERLPLLLEANPVARLVAEPELAAEMRKVGHDAAPLHPSETVDVAGVGVRAVGGDHAVIHEEIPRIGNVGFVLTGPGEPAFFHPGDCYDASPNDVDVLALPLSAPWAKFSETADFLRAVAPRVAVPIHDAVLSPAGREVYLRQTRALAPEGTDVRDLAGAGAVEL